MDTRQIIRLEFARMEIGETKKFSGCLFRDAFPTHSLFECRPLEDQFLEGIIGANYGSATCVYDLWGDVYIVSKQEAGHEKIRTDFDRR